MQNTSMLCVLSRDVFKFFFFFNLCYQQVDTKLFLQSGVILFFQCFFWGGGNHCFLKVKIVTEINTFSSCT